MVTEFQQNLSKVSMFCGGNDFLLNLCRNFFYFGTLCIISVFLYKHMGLSCKASPEIYNNVFFIKCKILLKISSTLG